MRGRVRVEEGRKWVRARVGGEWIADTRRPLLVWEKPYYPTYYIPRSDVRADLLIPNGRTERSPSRGEAIWYTLKLEDREVLDAAYAYPGSPIEELRDAIALRWDAMDRWFEEEEPIVVHPRDPYHRIDILASSRHVRIEIDGETVADSRHPMVLFETGLPPRFYLPPSHVRLELLEPSGLTTACPYKGTARYWSVRLGDTVHENVVWAYETTLPESAKIAGRMAFYDERVDVYVDGTLQERPRTPFS